MSDQLSPFPWFDVVIIVGLVLLNGVFAMSELAIVSSREARLRAPAKAGSARRQMRARAGRRPGRFLSTVQIGITLIGVLAGAYSGASLGGPVAQRLALLGPRAGDRRDGRLRPRHRPRHLPVADHRRAGAQAVRASRARADRGRHGAADALAVGRDRAVRVAARQGQRADLPAARPQPRIARTR